MSEIYMRKKAFWNEKDEMNKTTTYRIACIILTLILIGILLLSSFYFILPIKQNFSKTEIPSSLNYTIHSSNSFSKFSFTKFFRLKFVIPKQSRNNNTMSISNHSNIQSNDEIIKTENQHALKYTNESYTQDLSASIRFNPILQSNLYDKDYYQQLFNKSYIKLIFMHCLSDLNTDIHLALISKQIEIFYNFRMNKKKFEFEITNDYAADINYYNNQMCFISGTAHLALKTTQMPNCIEFKNFHINNFIFPNKRDANIFLKFHVFKINKNNKIHIYPASKQLINFNLIKEYSNVNDYFHNKNVLIYIDHVTGDKMIRICNILSLLDPEYYENNFWLEIVWNPEIQNLLCVERINYIN